MAVAYVKGTEATYNVVVKALLRLYTNMCMYCYLRFLYQRFDDDVDVYGVKISDPDPSLFVESQKIFFSTKSTNFLLSGITNVSKIYF